MSQTVFYGPPGVLGDPGSVRRLEEEVPEVQVLEPLRLRLGLRLKEYELQLVSAEKPQRRMRLRADQPLKRQNTAARPACAPSTWSV